MKIGEDDEDCKSSLCHSSPCQWSKALSPFDTVLRSQTIRIFIKKTPADMKFGLTVNYLAKKMGDILRNPLLRE